MITPVFLFFLKSTSNCEDRANPRLALHQSWSEKQNDGNRNIHELEPPKEHDHIKDDRHHTRTHSHEQIKEHPRTTTGNIMTTLRSTQGSRALRSTATSNDDDVPNSHERHERPHSDNVNEGKGHHRVESCPYMAATNAGGWKDDAK